MRTSEQKFDEIHLFKKDIKRMKRYKTRSRTSQPQKTDASWLRICAADCATGCSSG
jgi:hypothetical protein